MEDWDAQKILDLYIHDYMVRKNMHTAAEVFAREANFPPKTVAIDPPDGFLTEWWSIFWDVYSANIAKNPEQGEMLFSKAKQIVGSMGKNVHPNMPMPDMNSLMQNINPAMCIPGLPNMLQSVNPPLMPRPDIGTLNQNTIVATIPRLEQNPNRFGPVSVLDFTARQGQGMTSYLEAIMRDQERHRLQARDMNFNSQKFDVDRLVSMTPSSSTPKRVHKTLSINNQLPVTRYDNSGTILRRSAPLRAEPKPSETRALQIKAEPADTGIVIVNEVPSDGCPSTVVSHIQQDSKSELAEKTSGQLILSSSGSSNHMGTPILFDDGSKEKKPASGNNRWGEKPLEEDVESFFSNEVPDDLSPSQQICSPHHNIEHQGFPFKEVGSLHPTNNKLLCCDFSTPGNFLAAAGHEKKMFVMNLRDATYEAIQGHTQLITDIRFKPKSDIFATSSFDKTVRIWDAANPRKYLWSLVGHAEQVVSLDFHPRKFSFLCSCDSNEEIRFWDVNGVTCKRTFKGANRHVRFQPGAGNLLAAANGNIINLIDVETGRAQYHLEGHASDVNSICWDLEGKFLVSVSADSACVWSIESGPKCVHELHSAGNKFASCTFHPSHARMVVVGSYQSLHIWDPTMGNRSWTYGSAHEGIVSALSHSSKTNIIASVSHDHWIKLWK